MTRPRWQSSTESSAVHQGGAHILQYPTATEAHDALGQRLAFGTHRFTDYDWAVGTDVGLDNVMLVADSFAWEYDIKRAWLLRQRWGTLARQYVHPFELDRWSAMIPHTLKRGVDVWRADVMSTDIDPDDVGRDELPMRLAEMTTNTVEGKGTGRGVRRRWGSCILSVSYRHKPVPQLTIHSRTSYIGYLSILDLTVAHTLAYVAHEMGAAHPEDMRLVWILEMAQFHGFRSMAWVMTDLTMREEFHNLIDSVHRDKLPPGVRKLHDGLKRIQRSDQEGKPYGDEKFSSFARVRRRYHTEILGFEYGEQFEGGTTNRGGKNRFKPLPSVSTNDLDFTVLRG
jgi:hypothetical protein